MFEWIDYKQKQPEKPGRCLCAEITPFEKDFIRYKMPYWLTYPKRGWYLEDGTGGLMAYKGELIRYWTPVPDLPEEKNDA